MCVGEMLSEVHFFSVYSRDQECGEVTGKCEGARTADGGSDTR